MTALYLTLSAIFFLIYLLSSPRGSVRLIAVVGMSAMAPVSTAATLLLIKVGFDND